MNTSDAGQLKGSITFALSEDVFLFGMAVAAELFNVEDLSRVSGNFAAAGGAALFRDELRALASTASHRKLIINIHFQIQLSAASPFSFGLSQVRVDVLTA